MGIQGAQTETHICMVDTNMEKHLCSRETTRLKIIVLFTQILEDVRGLPRGGLAELLLSLPLPFEEPRFAPPVLAQLCWGWGDGERQAGAQPQTPAVTPASDAGVRDPADVSFKGMNQVSLILLFGHL